MRKSLPAITLLWLYLATPQLLTAQLNQNALAMPSDNLIASRVTKLTQLDRLFGTEITEPCNLDGLNLPFIGSQLKNQKGIRIRLAKGRLKLKSAAPGYKDPYERQFSVVFDSEAKRILSITSRFEGNAPDMRPEPPVDVAEGQLKAHGETYDSFPESDPKVSFLDALDSLLVRGLGSPFNAKEIDGYYVNYARNGVKRPAWIILLRGLTPFRQLNDGKDWQRNHARNVVDAETAELLQANTLPQPAP